MSRPMTVLATVAGVVLVAVAAFLAVIYAGIYDVAATTPHWEATRWALDTLQHGSVGARAADVQGQPPTAPDELHHGFEHYQEMCVQCHGAPGVERGEVGKGMRPTPPRLEEEAHEWTDAELFWIAKHGIRLAGMPAFGPTHSDEELWAIVGFVRQLETMTEQEYAERVRQLEAAASGEHEHTGSERHEGTTPEQHGETEPPL